MLQELFEAVQAQGVKASVPPVLHPPQEPEHVYFTRDDEGQVTRREAEPAPRGHKASDLQAIVEFAKINDGSVVWFGRSAVVCLIDDKTRRDRVTLTLDYSPQLKAIQAMESNARRPWNQKEFILLLRTTFARCLGQAGNLIECIRSLKYRDASEGESTVRQGKASIGKRLEQEVTGASAIPETFVFDVPIFASGFPSLRASIEIALEVDVANATFQLIPIAGDVEAAITGAEAEIGVELGEALNVDGEPAKVFFGQP